MKFEIQPEIFDNFIDAICIINEDLFPIYFNPSFSNLMEESSARAIRKKKITDLMQLEDFDWEYVKKGITEHLSSQVREVGYTIKNRVGQLQITWSSIQLTEGKSDIILYIRDVSLEAELTRKYHEQLSAKNETIKNLDETIFQISLIKDVLERANTDDDPIVMLKNLFTNLAQIFQFDYILYQKEEGPDSVLSLKTYTGPVRMDDRIVQMHSEAIKPEIKNGNLDNISINGYHWISFQFKDDSDQARHFIFGKINQFLDREKNLIQTICEPLSFSLDNRELFKKAITDEMTDLYNHRYFKLRLQKEIKNHEETQKKMGLLILDIDFFKKFNDTYGHLVGDIVLTHVATCMKNFCRVTDIPARYGGEEFALILQDVQEDAVFGVGDRLRQSIENLEVEVPGFDIKLRVTCSIGVSVYPVNAVTPLDLISLADQCLYEAKKAGRNKCIVSKVLHKKEAA